MLLGRNDEGSVRPTWRATIARMKTNLVALILLLLNVAAWGQCSAPFAVGETTKSYTDPTRNNRAVAVLIRYPKQSPAATEPLAGCAFARVAVGHGFTIPGDRYGYLSAQLVPLGYVLVFVRSEEGFSPSHETFARDLVFALRALAQDVQFANVVGAPSAVLGHSMGGGASFLAASFDPQLRALIALAPAETTPSAIAAAASLRLPTLVMTGSNDCVTPLAQHVQPMLAALATAPQHRRHSVLTGGTHCQFSDGYFTCSIGEGMCPAAGITAVQQQLLVSSEVSVFLARYLRDGLIFFDGFEG